MNCIQSYFFLSVFVVDIKYFQFNYAVSTNSSQRQWVDLGIHTEACMTRPETCGAAGGAISVWLKINDCGDGGGGGVFSTIDGPVRGGIQAHCSNKEIMYVKMFTHFTSEAKIFTHYVAIPCPFADDISNYFSQ